MGVEDVFRVPGKLYWGVTDLTIAAPYGGTELGLLAEAAATEHPIFEVTTNFQTASTPVDYYTAGAHWTFAATLRDWQDEALVALFAASGTPKVVSSPGSAHPGSKASSSTLLFAPIESTVHPSFLAYRAYPGLAESRELALQLLKELVIPVFLVCLPNSSGIAVQIGLLSGLTL